MFDTPLSISNKGETVTQPPFKMLQPIKKAKYPDITEVRHICTSFLRCSLWIFSHRYFSYPTIGRGEGFVATANNVWSHL